MCHKMHGLAATQAFRQIAGIEIKQIQHTALPTQQAGVQIMEWLQSGAMLIAPSFRSTEEEHVIVMQV